MSTRVNDTPAPTPLLQCPLIVRELHAFVSSSDKECIAYGQRMGLPNFYSDQTEGFEFFYFCELTHDKHFRNKPGACVLLFLQEHVI